MIAERAGVSNAPKIQRELFVGRQAERQKLLSCLNALDRGDGAVVLLEADAGMGKTRLIEELQNSARMRQIQIAYGKGEDDSAVELLAPLSTALRQNYRPEWMASKSFPSFSKRLLQPFITKAETVRNGVVPSDLNRSVPFDTALRHLLEEICSKGPFVLCLDDLQWGEASLWPLLQTVCRVTRHQPLLVLMSFRPIEMGENELGQQAIREVERQFLPEQIQLSGLTLGDINLLAADLDSDLPADKVEEIYHLSRGNPFIAKEFLLNEGEPTKSLHELLQARFLALSQVAQQNLYAAVVLGNSFAYDIWQECSGGHIELKELIAGRFVVQNDDVNGYSFYHDFLRSMLYHRMSEAKRIERHLIATQVLIRAKVSAEQIAWHCESANQLHEAVYYHKKAAENSLLVHGYQNARRHVEAAQKLGGQIELSAEAALRLDLLELKISQISDQSNDDRDQLIQLKRVAAQLEDVVSIIQIAQLAFHMKLVQGDHTEIEPACVELLEVAEQHGDDRDMVESLLLVADAKMNVLMKSKEGFEIIDRALVLIEKLNENLQYRAAAKLLQANAFLRLRQTEKASDAMDAVHQLLDQHPELEPMSVRFDYLATVLLQIQGYTYEAFERYKSAVTMFKTLDDLEGLARILRNVSHSASLLGQHEEAIAAAEELLHLAMEKADVMEQRFAQIRYGDSCILGGYIQEGEQALKDIIPWLKSGATGRVARRGWHAYGGLCFFQERYEEAFLAYSKLIEIVEDQQEITQTPFLVYAETAKIIGKDQLALEMLERIEELFDTQKQTTSSDMYRFYVYWFVCDDFAYLRKARETAFLVSDPISDEKVRRDYVERDPVFKFWHAAWSRETRPIKIDLPSTIHSGLETVELTFDYGEHDLPLLKQLGKAGLRHERIKRLLSDAAYRRVSLSNVMMAQLMGVNVRTIERDMQKLK